MEKNRTTGTGQMEAQSPLNALNSTVAQIRSSVEALGMAQQLQGGSAYTLEQRVHTLEAMLSAGLTALTIAAAALNEQNNEIERLKENKVDVADWVMNGDKDERGMTRAEARLEEGDAEDAPVHVDPYDPRAKK